MQVNNKFDIQHAENGGEFRITGTRFSADGYCAETNTIYEYHGDYWHGNPMCFNPWKRNKSNNTQFGELYRKTLEREQLICDLGYNLEDIWESEWKKAVRCVTLLQNIWKNRQENSSKRRRFV
jgi:G:T-mismatch repair DNA endonuclease (very short patch repair protein)